MSGSPLRGTLVAALTALAFGAVSDALAADPRQTAEALEQPAANPQDRERSTGQTIITEGMEVWHAAPVHVTARGTVADWPSALATDTLQRYEHAIAEPPDFQAWITQLPGIGATGQNGLFETFSIRGSGGNGILVLAAGVPIASQRRAGVPVSFVEPWLLGDVSVTRGPAVVHFGPGALGGAVSLEPRWFQAPFAVADYASAGNEAVLAAATGTESYSVAAARHRAGDSQAPDGRPLNTGYTRSSASLQYQQRFGALLFDALLMPSRTDDIGKSNSRFPDQQVTDYPEDDHVLWRLRARHDRGFEASLYGHEQKLTTFKQTPGKPDAYAYIASHDGGAILQQTWKSGAFKNNVGLEYFGRRDVTGYDAKGSLANRTYSLENARENSWSLFALSDWAVTRGFALELGTRATWINQQQSGARANDSDAAFSAAVVWTPAPQSRWSLNLASGYRFASLEERFFTGVTGRGEIVGNPRLGSEHSRSLDLGHIWWRGDWGAEFHLWETHVNGLIQKIELEPGVEGFVNIGRGRLYGAEATVDWTPPDGVSLSASAALVRGRDRDTDQALYGIPPLRAALEAAYDVGPVTLAGRYTHQWAMTRPGFEELRRPAVDLVDTELRYRVNAKLRVKLYARNLFNKLYYATADELSAFAPERSVGFNVVWEMN